MLPRDLYSRLLLISQLTPHFNYKTIKIFILNKENCQQHTVNDHAVIFPVLLQIEHALYPYTRLIFNTAFHGEDKEKFKSLNKHKHEKVENLY